MSFKNELHQQSHLLLKEGKVEQALVAINKALELLPDDPDVLSDRGVLYFHIGKPNLAVLDMNKCVLIEPNKAYRYSSRAYILSKIGNVEGAIADYKKAIELDPEDAIAYNNLGLVQEQMGKNDMATKLFEKADKLAGIPKKDNMLHFSPDEKKPVAEITFWGIVKTTFFTVQGFKEFLRFLFSGFKVKK